MKKILALFLLVTSFAALANGGVLIYNCLDNENSSIKVYASEELFCSDSTKVSGAVVVDEMQILFGHILNKKIFSSSSHEATFTILGIGEKNPIFKMTQNGQVQVLEVSCEQVIWEFDC